VVAGDFSFFPPQLDVPAGREVHDHDLSPQRREVDLPAAAKPGQRERRSGLAHELTRERASVASERGREEEREREHRNEHQPGDECSG
jgi:hypothetical protein